MKNKDQLFRKAEEKMRQAGCSQPAIEAFRIHFNQVASGEKGLLPETEIEPLETVPGLEDLDEQDTSTEDIFNQVAVIKLNGGLGTSMGMPLAKSLLEVKDGHTFLDIIANQLRRLNPVPRFILMNSFSTTADTMEKMQAYPDLYQGETSELLQGRVPKLLADKLEPVTWDDDPALEWCPPGHGEVYMALSQSGILEHLMEQGIKYIFISNADNLGAIPDKSILAYMQGQGLDFLMEVCQRTANDRKGGHLVRSKSGKLILRESAQCPEGDKNSFQDIERHRYFNTNNIWVNLESLNTLLDRHNGLMVLPLIKNTKQVDPADSNSTRVWQLESAMGAAIEYFDHAGALLVPKIRFAPVKTTNELLLLRSDVYELTDEFQLHLSSDCHNVIPVIDLDNRHYRLINDFDELFANIPSLTGCARLSVTGRVKFNSDTSIRGEVSIINGSDDVKELRPGRYTDEKIIL